MPDLPSDLTPAEAIDDLWEFIRFPFMSVSTGRSKWMSEWVMRFSSDRLFARLSWVNPRGHPWRFVFLVGIMTGVGLFLLQMFEGPPPTFQIGLFLAGIFITAELAATVVGYAIFGGYLGLRPPFRRYF